MLDGRLGTIILLGRDTYRIRGYFRVCLFSRMAETLIFRAFFFREPLWGELLCKSNRAGFLRYGDDDRVVKVLRQYARIEASHLKTRRD